MIRDDDSVELDIQQASHNALAALRRESLDIYNRLHSIQEDIAFVGLVRSHYCGFPLLPNLRCGAWYTDPALATHAPAYFKSTDGHTGNWSFNLRRANLHLLPLIAENYGILLVDSTRTGKRMPDALSKTVPIWCAVVNRAILIRRKRRNSIRAWEWDTRLYVPPGVVSPQEHHQITNKLDDWAEALADSSFDLPLDLQAPLRPFWITPSTTTYPKLNVESASLPFFPIICVSASKQVEAGTERRASGFAYVQGSGDDHELWGMGLTPQMFWKHRAELISSPRADLENVIRKFLSSSSSPYIALLELDSPPTAIQRLKGRVRLGSFSPVDLNSQLDSFRLETSQDIRVAYIILDFSPVNTDDGGNDPDTNADAISSSRVLHIYALPKTKAKSDAHFLQYILPTAIPFIQSHLSSDQSNTVSIIEGCGNDPGCRLDFSVGVGLTAIQSFFDENGSWLDGRKQQVDKKTIRTRLEWIIESEPRANPSRATLKRVNEFLLTPSAYLTTVKP